MKSRYELGRFLARFISAIALFVGLLGIYLFFVAVTRHSISPPDITVSLGVVTLSLIACLGGELAHAVFDMADAITQAGKPSAESAPEQALPELPSNKPVTEIKVDNPPPGTQIYTPPAMDQDLAKRIADEELRKFKGNP